MTRGKGQEEKMVATFAASKKSWMQTLYVFSGGMAVWFGIVGGLALHG